MPAVSSHELWGVMWCEILILPTSFVTLDGYSSLHGLQFAQLKTELGIVRWGLQEGVTQEGVGGRHVEGAKKMVVTDLQG